MNGGMADLAIAILRVHRIDEEGCTVVPHKVKNPRCSPQQPVSLHRPSILI